jgi:hypothetical protein
MSENENNNVGSDIVTAASFLKTVQSHVSRNEVNNFQCILDILHQAFNYFHLKKLKDETLGDEEKNVISDHVDKFLGMIKPLFNRDE